MQLFFICSTTYLLYAVKSKKKLLKLYVDDEDNDDELDEEKNNTHYVVVVLVVFVYSHSCAHKYQHYCENSIGNKSTTHNRNEVTLTLSSVCIHYFTPSIYQHAHTPNNITYRKYTHAKRNFTKV